MDIIFQRHYVSNSRHVESLKEIIDRTIEASKTIGSDAPLLGLRVAYRASVDDSTYFDVCKQMSRLKGSSYLTMLERSTETPGTSYNGAGTGLAQVLLNPVPYETIDKEPPVITSMDGDQYPVNDINLLEAHRELTKRLKNDKAVLGLGARTHVILSANPEADRLRRLHEMFQSVMIDKRIDKSNINPKKLDLSQVPLSYRELNDSTPGFYAINHGSPVATEVVDDLKQSALTADLRGFAFDYTLAPMVASKGQKIECIYVPSPEHLSVHHKREQIEALIRDQTSEVLKTTIRDFALGHIESKETGQALGKYFSLEDIDCVRKLMLDSKMKAK